MKTIKTTQKIGHSHIIFLFLVLMNLLMTSAVLYIWYELQLVNRIVTTMSNDVADAVEVVKPFVKKMENVATSVVEISKSTNLAYAAQRKSLRQQSKWGKSNITPEQFQVQKQQLTTWSEKIFNNLKIIRNIIDQVKRNNDESGGHFRIIQQKVDSFSKINDLQQVTSSMQEQVLAVLVGVITLSVLTSLFLFTLMQNALTQNWVKSQLAGLHDQMRGELNITQLSQCIITYLAETLNIPLGLLYTRKGNTLTLAATHAYPLPPDNTVEFAFGQGLPGQAAQNNKPLLFSDVSSDYLTIRSGLGKTTPRNILLLPFAFENHVRGVVELGLMRRLSNSEQAFLTQAIDNIAIGFNSAEYRTRLQQLLEEAQTQAEELEAQQEEIQSQREWFETTLKSISDGIITTDIKAQVTFMNPVAEQLTGYALAEIRGTKINDVFHILSESSRTEVENPVERIIEEESIINLTNHTILLARDGREIPIENSGAPIHQANGSLIGTVLIFRDISARREAEVEVEHARQEAILANQAKSRFLANMSHELRTPLNGILGYAQILELSSDLSPKQREGVNVIRSCGEHLLTLISDILDLSKIEAGRVELFPVEIDLGEFLRDIVKLFQIRAEQKGITFVYHPQLQLPTNIYMDDKCLRQILINLLGNAVKFTQQGGVIFTVNCNDEGHIQFLVEDTGFGIPTEDMDKIFRPFQQASNHDINTEGTGLGLSITQKLVDMMNGELQVKSTLGEGSIFEVVLPLANSAEVSQSKYEQQVVPFIKVSHNVQQEIDVSESKQHTMPIGFAEAACKVLVVDDKQENRAVVRHLLEPLGFEVLEAEDGQQGLEQACEHLPELILMDLIMPVMNGFECTRQIRQHSKLSDTVIIAASASVFEEDQQKSLAAGCNDFTAKPIQAALLLPQLQKHLNLTWLYEHDASGSS